MLREQIGKTLPIVRRLCFRSDRAYNMSGNKMMAENDEYRYEVEKIFSDVMDLEAEQEGVQFDLGNWVGQLPDTHWVYETNIISVLEINYLRLSEVYRQSKTSYL